MRTPAVLATGFLLSAAIPLFAHHSFAAEFDANKKVQFTGTVTKLEWMNPHAWVYIDAKDQSGHVQHWQCETGAPNELVRKGWRRNDLKVGDQVTVDGFLAKVGGNTCNAREIKLPNGKKVFSGSADDGGPGSRNPTGGGAQ
jgi:hypothetical protein